MTSRFFLFAAWVLVGFGSAASQAPVLDQVQSYWTGYESGSAGTTIAQTFTPSIEGQLDHISLAILFRDPSQVFPITLQVVETGDGIPTGVILGRRVFSDYTAQLASYD